MVRNLQKLIKNKWFRFAIIVVLVYLLYMATLQPLVASLCCPPIVRSGVDLYTENEYLQFDDGNVFQTALAKIPLHESSKVKAFSHYNNFLRDNLVYGEFCDAFVLDLSLDEQYEAVKEYVVQNSDDCVLEDGCEMYWLQDAVPADDACFFVAVFDHEKMIRCILITDYGNTLGFAGSADSVLLRNFGIDWTEDILPQ